MADPKAGIFGIDLGTTYSVISRIDDQGRASVIRDDVSGSDTTPSVVFFETATNVVVGATAKDAAATNPDQVVTLVKREMGTKGWEREFFGTAYSAPEISALILKKLKDDAEASTGQVVEQVVITVPAYFGLLEKEATRQAGTIAGLDVIGIIPEPVAAALQYEVVGGADATTVLVYDLGGGTFDVSIMRISAGSIEVVVTDGNHHLGGADWDQRLLQHLVEAATAQLGTEDVRDDEGFMQDLNRKAEDTKRRLSSREAETVRLYFGGASAEVVVSRSEFEDLTRDLLDETMTITDRALAAARVIDPSLTIDEVLLVGGSSLMPAVSRTLEERYGWKPRLSDPHLSVAKGAAVYAAARTVWTIVEKTQLTDGQHLDEVGTLEGAIGVVSEQSDIEPGRLAGIVAKTITNVLPKAIGIKLIDTSVAGWEAEPERFAYVEHLLLPNVTLPASAEFTAGTLFAGQTAVEIELFEQAGGVPSRVVGDNTSIQDGVGSVAVPSSLPAGSPVKINVQATDEGLITLTAIEPASGERLDIVVQLSLHSKDEIDRATQRHGGLTVSS